MERKTPTRRLFLQSAGVASTIMIAGCSGNNNNNNNNSTEDNPEITESPEDTDAPEDSDSEKSRTELLKERYPNWAFIDGQTYLVVLKPLETSADSYSVTISGTIVNGSKSDYEYAQISLGLYSEPNGEGAKVGSAIDNISGLESGQKWQFEAVGTSDDAASFDIEDTTAY